MNDLSSNVVAFRPAPLPALGYRVDVHDFGNQWHVLLFQNRAIASQANFASKADAERYARGLAQDHRCIVIHHKHDGSVPEPASGDPA